MAKYNCVDCQHVQEASEFANIADLKCEKCGGSLSTALGRGNGKFPPWAKKLIIPISLILLLIIWSKISALECELKDDSDSQHTSRDCVDEYTYDNWGESKQDGGDGKCDVWQKKGAGYTYEIWLDDGASKQKIGSKSLNSNSCDIYFKAVENKNKSYSWKEFKKKFGEVEFIAKEHQKQEYVLQIKDGKIRPCFNDGVAKIKLNWKVKNSKIPLSSSNVRGSKGVVLTFKSKNQHPSAVCDALPVIESVTNNRGCKIKIKIEGLSNSDFDANKDIEVSISGKNGPWEHKIFWDWDTKLSGQPKNVWVRNRKHQESAIPYVNNDIESWENECTPWTNQQKQNIIKSVKQEFSDYFNKTKDLSIMSNVLITTSIIEVNANCCGLSNMNGNQPATAVLGVINAWAKSKNYIDLPLKVIDVQVDVNSKKVTLIKITNR